MNNLETIQIFDARQNKVISVEKIDKPDSEWKKLLTGKQYEWVRKPVCA